MNLLTLVILVLLSDLLYAQNVLLASKTGADMLVTGTFDKKDNIPTVTTATSIEKKDTVLGAPVELIKPVSVVEKTVASKGVALWNNTNSQENMSNLYALHKSARIGTMITLRNPMNGRTIPVKVVGRLPDSGEYKNVSMLVSAATARELHVLDGKFIVEQRIPVSSSQR